MRTKKNYDDNEKLIEFLAEKLNKGQLLLVLGSGISMPFGLPNWKRLIKNIYKPTNTRPPKKLSLIDQASYFKSHFCKNNLERLKTEVYKGLYSDYGADFLKLRNSAALGAVGALAMGSQRGSINKIVTFNFDNLLEYYLEQHGYVVHSAIDEKYWDSKADITIYHPHGFLPYEKNHLQSNKIVFDMESYNDIINRDKPWRQQLLTLFRTKICLFIGISFDDPNFRSLLMDSRDLHVTRVEKSLYWGITFKDNSDKVQKNFWENCGVYYKIVKDFKIHLPNILFNICRAAAKIK